MGNYRIKGGRTLAGHINPGGAKNAVLPILAASVLCDESILTNVPNLSDVTLSLDILEQLGCIVGYDGSKVKINSVKADKTTVPTKHVGKMRSSILFLGSMLGRFGEAEIGLPGGCKLGARKIDYHLDAFRKMGAVVEENEERGTIICHVPNKRLSGADITLKTPSVGATENIMLAAVLADGITTITNAAKEPEIVDLADFLNKSGAKVIGAGTGEIVVTGVKGLGSVNHRIIPDRIVAGTYLCAVAMTGGDILLNDVIPTHMTATLNMLRDAGCRIKHGNGYVWIASPDRLKSLKNLTTDVYPGFPTDMQAQFAAMQCIADGECIIRETIFESRDKHFAELTKMGANIKVTGDEVTVKGMARLRGATVAAPDLRGGAALILAGLAASGETIVNNSEHVERGYESIEAALSWLGAEISLEP
ncbi:MAG: UDP-N-acetylglucosamine 1-carboxyvinyltransferase [Defluviitaleaceae bacterium]|nr:UDP-N-acetylglucosamine 1-carboxyvinyltransferase [Defluviitaleaceae bacterium]